MQGRAVSPVIGFVLLVGIAAAGSVALLVVGAEMTGDVRSSVETAQAEDSLSSVAATADELATGGGDRADFSVRGADGARVSADESAGRVTINHTGSEFEHTTDLGVLAYEDGDATLAYQGGGVWRTGGDSVTMVRAPQFHYRGASTPTLTFPIINVTGEYAASAGDDGELVVNDRTDVYPTEPDHYNPLENGSVTVTLESEYCAGWQRFFEQRTTSAVNRSCGEDPEGVLETHFDVPFVLDGVDDPKIGEDSDAESVTWLVEKKANQCEGVDDEVEGETLDSTELYCVDEISDGFTADTAAAGDDMEIYVEEGIDMSGGTIAVEGPHNVSLFIDDDIGITGNAQISDEDSATQTRMFLSETADIDENGQGNMEIYALIYAPDSTVTLQGSPTFKGAIIANEYNPPNGNSGDVSGDPSFENIYIEEKGAGEPFYYLHLTETTVDVRESS